MRNPWARLVSTYENIYWYHLYDKKPWFRKKPPFKQWLKAADNKGHGGGGKGNRRWLTYGTYSIENYAGDGNGNLLVDKIVKLESIDEQLNPYLREIGLGFLADKPVPRINTLSTRKPARKKDFRRYYDDETQQLVADRYEFEIARFGYHFG